MLICLAGDRPDHKECPLAALLCCNLTNLCWPT